MDRLLTCKCGEKNTVTRAQAGQQVKCSSCNELLIVPTLRGLDQLPVAEQSKAQSVIPTNIWSIRGPIIAFCLVGLVLCGGYAFYQDYWARVAYTPMNQALHEQEMDQRFEHANLNDMLVYWDNYSLVRLQNKAPQIFAQYKLMNDYSREARKKSLLYAGATVGLALIAIATIVSAKIAMKEKSSS